MRQFQTLALRRKRDIRTGGRIGSSPLSRPCCYSPSCGNKADAANNLATEDVAAKLESIMVLTPDLAEAERFFRDDLGLVLIDKTSNQLVQLGECLP